MKTPKWSLILVGFLFLFGIVHSQADLVLHHANVYTVDKKKPTANAVAVQAGKIIFVGSDEGVKRFIGKKTEVIDCQGQFLMPGFIEGHGHIHGLGSSLINLNLMHAKSWDEIVGMVGAAVKKAKPGEWIIGRGWHQEKWISSNGNGGSITTSQGGPTPGSQNAASAKTFFMGYPYHFELSKISPDNPVLLSHASGHASFVNAKAMELAGITGTTVSPSGGEIVKDKDGVILGVLEETAAGLVSKAYNAYLSKQSLFERKVNWQRSMALAEDECLKKGVTSFQDAGSSWQQVEWMKELASRGELNVRHWVMVRDSYRGLLQNASSFTAKNSKNDFITVRAIKVSLDGALGSYGAWLLKPYADRDGWVGQPTANLDSLKAIAQFAWNNDLQLCVHAIGDRANREVIDIYSAQISKNRLKDHRWRVEHAQHVNPTEIPRFKQNKVIASMQGIHCTSDAPFVPKRLGEDRSKEGAYVWRSFLDAGVVVNNGTDVPVEDIDPIQSFYSSVTRKLKDGSVFHPEQKMTRAEGIYSYTMANAYAAFEDKTKGSIEVTKLADMVLLSKDLINCTDEEILQTKVLMTIVGGKIKYKSEF